MKDILTTQREGLRLEAKLAAEEAAFVNDHLSFSAGVALDLTEEVVSYTCLAAQTVPVEYGSLYGDVEQGEAQFRGNGVWHPDEGVYEHGHVHEVGERSG